ncbi:MAG: hypothetical protein H6Q43_51, partial [Deltaproteobacteria bacterium]|nr:hypothetical protein [Deltaproteobacteria bacterium]
LVLITFPATIKNPSKQKNPLGIGRSFEQFLCRFLWIKNYMIFNSYWEYGKIIRLDVSKRVEKVTFLTGKEGKNWNQELGGCKFCRLIFSIRVVRFRFKSWAALFLTQPVLIRACRINFLSNSLTASSREIPLSGISAA